MRKVGDAKKAMLFGITIDVALKKYDYSLKHYGSTLRVNSPDAVNLLLGTACQESNLTHRKQHGTENKIFVGGSSLFQIEWATFRDMFVSWFKYRPSGELKALADACELPMMDTEDKQRLFYDLISTEKQAYETLAIIIARLKYYRSPDAIPSDWQGKADMWKKVYNTPQGKGKPDEFMAKVKHYELDR